MNEIQTLDYLKYRENSHPGRQYISFLYENFRFNGPNGTHICLVTEVLGPTLAHLVSLGKQLRAATAQKVSRQFVQAVAYLHSEDVIHGGASSVLVERKSELLTLV